MKWQTRNSATDASVVQSQMYLLPVATRVPLKFGAETLTSVSCLRVRLAVAGQDITKRSFGERHPYRFSGHGRVHWTMACGSVPTKVMSYGGRFEDSDNGETPDTEVVMYELDSIPVIFESRGLGARKGSQDSEAFRAVAKNGVVLKSGEQNPRPKTGVMIQCEDGYVDLTPRGEYAAYDNDGHEVASFKVEEDGPKAEKANQFVVPAFSV